MNAPFIELLLRAANVAMVGVTLAALILYSRLQRDPARPLVLFLTVVVAVQGGWRTFVLWLGFQSDVGHLGWALAWAQPMNAALLFLLNLAIALLVLHRVRHRPFASGAT